MNSKNDESKDQDLLLGRTGRERKKLRRVLTWFSLGIGIPLFYFVYRSYNELQRESFYQYSLAAKNLATQIDESVYKLLEPEEKRAFEEYSFFNVAQNPLWSKTGVTFSPLSEYPPRMNLPGLIGYFQINPDGSFRSPLLPDTTQSNFNIANFGINQEELTKREALNLSIQSALSRSKLISPSRSDAFERRLAIDRGQEVAVGETDKMNQVTSQRDEAPENKKEFPSQGQGKLSALNIDSRQYAGQSEQSGGFLSQLLNRSNIKSPRKEKISIPAEDNYQSAKDNQQIVEEKVVSSEIFDDVSRLGKKDTTVRILTFEGEIDPLQLIALEDGHLVFFRKVWRENQRFIQGFLVDQGRFLKDLAETQFYGNSLGSLSSLIVFYREKVVRELAPTSSARHPDAQLASAKRILLHTAVLSPPLQDFELVFAVTNLPKPAGFSLIYFFMVILVLGFPLGIYSIYKLGSAQIDLSERQNNFVSAVSHELKTPLTSIRMYSEMLRSGWVGEEEKQKSYYDFIFHESERLSRLIANVLTLSKITTNPQEPNLRRWRADELFDLIKGKITSQIEAQGFSLEVMPPKEGEIEYTIMADEDAVTMIFINLVDNGLKFSKTQERKTIVFGCRTFSGNPTKVSYYVRDFGPGIPPDQKKKIFKLFYRLEDELTRKTPGTGIGLSLVKELSSKMHASVDLINREPGVEFVLTFDAI